MPHTEVTTGWLAVAGREQVALNSTVISAIPLDDSDLDRSLAAARQIRDAGQVALVRRWPALVRRWPALMKAREEVASLMELECLVETVGNCAVVPLSAIDGSTSFDDNLLPTPSHPLYRIPPFPCLLAEVSTIRYLVSYADGPPPDSVICRSLPVRTDFSEYSRLWTGSGSGENKEAIIERLQGATNRHIIFAYLLGEMIAKLHQTGILHGDAHIGNFCLQRNGYIGVFEHDEDRWLDRPPSPAQCATDLAPLLISFSPADWRAFRFGYVRQWPDGQNVIDFIEVGDATD